MKINLLIAVAFSKYNAVSDFASDMQMKTIVCVILFNSPVLIRMHNVLF